MDTMPVTGEVMTYSLKAVITDSAPGMAAYVTGSDSNNNQEGVYPDNTPEDAFDDPRIEYFGELLRRTSGPCALRFTGTYDNTDVVLKILRSTTGAWKAPR